jgi:hypothetical protein
MPVLHATVVPAPSQIALGDDEFDDALDRHEGDEDGERHEARHRLTT